MSRPRSLNPSTRALYQREWAEKNREKSRAYSLKHKSQNLERVRAANIAAKRASRALDAEPSRLAAKRYKERNPEKVALQIQTSKNKKPDLYQSIMKRADFKRRCQQAGITPEDFALIHDSQGGACWICRSMPDASRLFLDHDHQTGLFRGLLCRKCNAGLGMFRDNQDFLLQAVEYLKRKTSQ